jgi:hypothetical protein
MAHCQLIITFSCRLTFIGHFEFKVRLMQIIVYIEGVKYII